MIRDRNVQTTKGLTETNPLDKKHVKNITLKCWILNQTVLYDHKPISLGYESLGH